MYPQTHFLFSYLIGLVFAKFGIIDYRSALFVSVVGLLIDVDHFIEFVFRYKEWSFKHAWNRAVNGLYRGRSFIHHQIGFVLITLIFVGLFYFNRNLFWIFALGYYSHLFLDYAHLNVLKIKGNVVIEEAGFVERISKFEVLLDIFFLIGILLVVL